MKRYTVWTFLFLLLFSSAAGAVLENDPIRALISEIEWLQRYIYILEELADVTQVERHAARVALDSIDDTLANVDVYLESARDALAVAANAAERADWASVIADLEQYRQEQVSQYNSVAYTIELLDAEIERIEREIIETKKQLEKAILRLMKLVFG